MNRIWWLILGGLTLIEAVDFLTANTNTNTREANDHNPCGVTATSIVYSGQIGLDPPLATFDNDLSGLFAAADNLYDYFNFDGVNTADGIAGRWVGNGSPDYISNFLAFTGYKTGQVLSYFVDGPKILDGISKCENGGAYQQPLTLRIFAIGYGPVINQAGS